MIVNKILQYLKKSPQKYADDLYGGQKVALLTKHAKERVLAPILDDALGCEVVLVDGYDTDLLGTFTRETPRAGTQVEAARKKAKIALELSALKVALASEGSFGPDPYAGMFAWNVECLVWIDTQNSLELVALAQGKSNLDHALLATWQECAAFAQKIGFPEHYLIIRPQENSSEIRKGISEWSKLQEDFEWAQSLSKNGSVFIETDMRAFANPTRMQIIANAADELAKKLSSVCPLCNAVGYSITESLRGLKCRVCSNETQDIYADGYSCAQCGHKVTQERENSLGASPAHCDFCNP